MPSSGFPMEDFSHETVDQNTVCLRVALEQRAQTALKNGLFTEWLESFVGAYNSLVDQGQPNWDAAMIASYAGIVEWDM